MPLATQVRTSAEASRRAYWRTTSSRRYRISFADPSVVAVTATGPRAWPRGRAAPSSRTRRRRRRPPRRRAGEAADEDREAAEQAPLRRQQLVAPVERRLERLVARAARCDCPCEEVEASSRRRAISAGVSTPTGAAASSIASGRPSRRLQISAIVRRVASADREARVHILRALDEEADRPRRPEHLGGAASRGGHRQRRHRARRLAADASGSLLVARIGAPGTRAGASTSRAAASIRCSQLSSTSSSAAHRRSRQPRPSCIGLLIGLA